MLIKYTLCPLMCLSLLAPSAHAQFAVIDIASVTQLIEEVQTLDQTLQTARSQLTQAQALYGSVTGSRGMQTLLAGTVRNYLPTDWAQLTTAMAGAGGSYEALSADVSSAVNANAILQPTQLDSLSAGERASVTAARRSVALLQALASEALSNSSARFASLQQLIDAMPGATDEKGILELQARINAEQGMLQNEQTKLQALYRAADSERLDAEQQTREQIVLGHGNFAARFEPAPP